MAEPAEAPTKAGTSAPPPGGGPSPSGTPQGGFDSLLLMLVSMGLIFYLLVIRPESKRRKQKEALLSGLKPKDKVLTIGGVYGTVIEVDGDEVVVLVDPRKDIRLRYRRSAVDAVIDAEGKDKGKEKEKK